MKVEHNIDAEKRKSGCPVGHCCDECNLYRPTYRKEQNGGRTQVWDCTPVHALVMLSEMKDRLMGVQDAVESLRNTVSETRPVVVYPKGRKNGQDQLKHTKPGGTPELLHDGRSIPGNSQSDGGDFE